MHKTASFFGQESTFLFWMRYNAIDRDNKDGDKVSNKILRNKSKTEDVPRKIRKMKWNWARHVVRMETNRWVRRKCTEWLQISIGKY